MKHAILPAVLLLSAFFAEAQSVTEISPGTYETRFKTAQHKWEKGDIVLLDDKHYKLTAGGDAGEYKFSAAAQRIFFTSGPLKSAYTKVSLVNSKPVIILPVEENGSLGLKAEIWASKE